MDIEFRIEARRDRLFGRWTAGRLGLAGEAMEDYARSLILTGLEEPSRDATLRRAIADLAELDIPEKIVRAALDSCSAIARRQIIAEHVAAAAPTPARSSPRSALHISAT